MLFTTPLTLSDGTNNHIYNWLYQVPGKLSGIYTETAATPSSESQLRSAHTTEKSGVERHLVSLFVNKPLTDAQAPDPTFAPVTVNISVIHHPLHSASSIDEVLAMSGDAVSEITAAALLRGEI